MEESRLLYWEVFNFMSIEHGVCEFDDTNIINLKGYNDSGKSAMLNALKVLIANSNPTKQIGFIQDDKEYFRIIAVFSDGIKILRDKYMNGQSLYEMYKDEKLIFTTKSGNTLTKVSEVPKPIADYLGMITYDNICLNARACFEKQIGVQTTGSENYKMFNTVLKSEEIASAGALLNNDKNKLVSDINATDYELQAQKGLYSQYSGINKELLEYLKSVDSNLDDNENKEDCLNRIKSTNDTLKNIVVYPELNIVDDKKLKSLENIQTIQKNITELNITPELKVIDTDKVNSMLSIKTLIDEIDSIKVMPEVKILNTDSIEKLSKIWGILSELNEIQVSPKLEIIQDNKTKELEGILTILNSIKDCNKIIENSDNQIKTITSELDELQKELNMKGVKMVKCPSCGVMFNADEVHNH